MSKLNELISETLALDEKATAGEWILRTSADNRRGAIIPIPETRDDWVIAAYAPDDGQGKTKLSKLKNFELMAKYRSSAPKLALIAKVCLEALKLSPQGCNNSGMYGPLGISPGECAKSKHACVPCRQRAAIREAEKIAGQE